MITIIIKDSGKHPYASTLVDSRLEKRIKEQTEETIKGIRRRLAEEFNIGEEQIVKYWIIEGED